MTLGSDALILIVEDDKALREGLVLNLELEGYRTVAAPDGNEGMRMALSVDAAPDLIVLDVMLPGQSGLQILSELRAKGRDVPVLILSAREKTPEKIEGLSLGADDYMVKPFELAELLARVEALLRRYRRAQAAGKVREISFGDVVIQPTTRRTTLNGVAIELGAKEFDLLSLLASHPGRPFSREEIIREVWGEEFDGTERTVDNYIVALRQKLESNPSAPRHIKTLRGVGYKLQN